MLYKRNILLSIIITLLVISLIPVVNADSFSNFATYGDGYIATNDTYTILMWNSSGSKSPFIVDGNLSKDSTLYYLAVAGGGGGGYRGGGGGAGALQESTLTAVNGQLNITIGALGTGGTGTDVGGVRGTNTTFGNLSSNVTMTGGSGGGSRATTGATLVLFGGSTGGGGSPSSTTYSPSNSSVFTQDPFGRRGGGGYYGGTTSYSGGGGGGSIRNGTNATSTPAGGWGGNATNTSFVTGKYYILAGGGGGGTYSNTVGNRGTGGGNLSSEASVYVGGYGGYRTTAPTAATASTGSGGGGSGSSGTGGSGSSGILILKFPTPVNATFIANITSGTAPLPVLFTDTSTGSPSAWTWNFTNVTGNNTPITFSTTQNPTQIFNVGNFSIVLNASKTLHSDLSNQVTFINVSTLIPPVSSFSANVTSGNSPLAVGFTDSSTNTPTSWNWSFQNITPGNNTQIWFSTSQNPSQVFGIGNFSIKLNASNSAGYNISAQTTFINVSNIGTVVFLYADTDAMIDSETVGTYSSLRNQVVGDWVGDNEIQPYLVATTTDGQYSRLDRGVLIFNTSTIPAGATITSAKIGLYVQGITTGLGGTPSLVITGGQTASNTSVVVGDYDGFTQVEYASRFLYSSIIVDQYTNITLTNLTFIQKGTPPVFTTVYLRDNWDVDSSAPWVSGADTGIERDTLLTASAHKPFLEVTYNIEGGAASPVASFTINKNIIRIPNSISVTDTSTNTPTSWDWYWGDGTTNSTTQNAVHVYTKRGMFTIILTATNGAGSDPSDPTSVKVIGFMND